MSRPRWDELEQAYLRGVDEPLSSDREREQRARLALDWAEEHELGRKTARAMPWWRWGMGAALATGAALALALFGLGRRPEPLDCHTAEGARVAQGQRVGSTSKSARLRFADGSRLVLEPGSSLRAEHLGAREVELVLEHGRLEAHVKRSARRTWRYRAGPYRVRVLGTSLHISWKSKEQRLEVGVTRGAVRVRGGAIGAEGRRITAGRRLEVHQGRISVLDKPSSTPDATPPADAGTPPADSARERTPPDAQPRSPRRKLSTRWRQLMLKGQHDAAWQAAKGVGLRRLEARASAADLLLLADLARLRGQRGLARNTLAVMRRRFKGKPHASLAAFELGRIAVSRADHGAAARWFGVYLREQPRGKRSAPALGRLMAALQKMGRRAEARRKAQAYLAAYPQGTYASLARTILRK